MLGINFQRLHLFGHFIRIAKDSPMKRAFDAMIWLLLCGAGAVTPFSTDAGWIRIRSHHVMRRINGGGSYNKTDI